MRNKLTTIGCTLAVLLLPTVASAGSTATKSVLAGSSTMGGSMNVRFDSSNDTMGARIISTATTSVVTFYATDSSSGNSFACSVTPSDAIFPKAEKAALSLKNGSSVTVYSSSGKCSFVDLRNASNYID